MTLYLSLPVAIIWLTVSAHGAAKPPKVVKPLLPAHGVKTPGVLIPYGSLKSAAEIALESPATGFLFTESIAMADASGVRRLDAKTNRPFEPALDIKGLDKPCGGLISAFSFVWTPVCGASSLAKLDMRPVPLPKEGEQQPKVEKTDAPKPEPTPLTPPAPPAFIATGTAPVAVAAITASEDSVWLLADAKTSLQRIDPKENKVVAEIRLPAACTAILAAEGSIWVACPGEAKLLRIDPRTNLVDKRIEVSAEPVSIAAGESSIWVLCRQEGKVARIDPKTNKVTATIDLAVPNADGTLAFGEGSLWASLPGFPLIRIAPATGKVAQQFHGDGGGVVAFGLGSVWVSAPQSKLVTRFDPKRVLATLAE